MLILICIDGCWYEGKRYQAMSLVNTSEPCLHCRCVDGSVRCRLRVCPRLPTIPPPGCIAKMPNENACCGELVCKNFRKYKFNNHCYLKSEYSTVYLLITDAKDAMAKKTNVNGKILFIAWYMQVH